MTKKTVYGSIKKIIKDLRQHRIIQVCVLRSKIFRQGVQIISRHTDVWVPIFGQPDGTRFQQDACRELCGVALTEDVMERSIGMIFTNFREIDKLGRIVISKDIRKHLGIEAGDILQINAEGDTIMIKKAEKKCVFCNSDSDLHDFEDKAVCGACLERLRVLS